MTKGGATKKKEDLSKCCLNFVQEYKINVELLQNKMFTSTFCCSYSVQSSDPSENYWHFKVCCLKTGSPSSSSRSSPASCPSPDPPESVRHPGADHAGKSLLFVGGEVVLGGAANLKVG